MAIYEFTADSIKVLPETTYSAAGIRERDDIQRLLKKQIEVVAPNTLIIAEEFCDWDDSRRRVDLLGIDSDANLVVIELKRTDDGGHMELQAIRYAAMVSAMTFEKSVEVYADFLQRSGTGGDARALILEFLEWDAPDADRFAQDVRIVLVSAEFSKELTTAVMWMNDHGIDITCVRMKPYAEGPRLFMDVQQVLPLPEAADYTIQIRAKATQEREARRGHSDLQQLLYKFWTGLLTEARTRTATHANVSAPKTHWIGATAGKPGLRFVYVFGSTGPRVELYIDNGDKVANKATFDVFFAKRELIENACRRKIVWERLENKGASRIYIEVPEGQLKDESTWPTLRKNMIDAMIELEGALRPQFQALR